MVLIITDRGDVSTCEVIDWLNYFDLSWVAITEKDHVQEIELKTNGEFELKFTDGKNIDSSLISKCWYRRGDIRFSPDLYVVSNSVERGIRELVNRVNQVDTRTLKSYFHYKLMKKGSLGSFLNSSLNKLVVLDKAKELGLQTPDSIVTCGGNRVKDFITENKRIIVKPITKVFDKIDNIFFSCYTTEITQKELKEVGTLNRFPSLFQKMIDKKYEIRSFFLDGSFYSMAIFSQEDKQTEVDFRRYNRKHPNRTVPFNLPSEIEERLRRLLESFKLRTGSIDLIYTHKNDFVFLEINPIGQFGMVCTPCNYYLHKKIAEWLNQKE